MTQYVAWPAGRRDKRGAHEALMTDDHRYASFLGVPLGVTQTIRGIAKGIISTVDVHSIVADALRPGTDTTHVADLFAIWLLTEECPSTLGHRVSRLYQRRIRGDAPTKQEWQLAGDGHGPWLTMEQHFAIAAARCEDMEFIVDGAADASYMVTWYRTRSAQKADAAAAASYRRMLNSLVAIIKQCKPA